MYLLNYLALTLPGGQTIAAPKQVPTGGLDKVQTIIGNALTIMIIVAIILVVVGIVWAGIQWAGSGGDKSKLAAARARLTWAVIGLIVVLVTFFILNFVGYLFKVDLLKLSN